MPKTKLQILRDQINTLDNQMIDILDRRSHIVTKIGKLKDLTKGVVDENREQTVLNRLINLAKGKYPKDTIIRLWREIFEASSKLQLKIKPDISTKRTIDKIKIYQGGKSNTDNNVNIVKLSSNENPFGPSNRINLNNISLELNRYPEISGITLRKEIAKSNKIEHDQIILGCGSDETLLFAALAFCQTGDEIIHSEYGFEMYSIIAKIVGAVSKLAKEKKYKLTVNSILEQVTPSTKLIYIANPNNPTGSYLSNKEIRKLMNGIPKNIIIVIDGAYAEYVKESNYDDSFDILKDYENVILTRTFSKAYGLAAIRLGWCYSSPKVISILNRIKGPFNANAIAQKMAIIALKDKAHLNNTIVKNKKNKQWFEKQLKLLGIKVIPTFANFSLIELKKNKSFDISNELEKEGILIRQLDSYNLPNCLRISIGEMKDMIKVIKIIKKKI